VGGVEVRQHELLEAQALRIRQQRGFLLGLGRLRGRRPEEPSVYSRGAGAASARLAE